MRPKNTIYFHLHIPRCAGSSLDSAISKGFDQSEKLSFQSYDQFWSLLNRTEDYSSKFKYISGHFSHGLHTCFDEIAPVYIVLLREPVARVVSLYSYHRNWPGSKLYRLLNTRNMSLANFYKYWPDQSVQFSNGQTRQLCDYASAGLLRLNLTHLEAATKAIKEPYTVAGVVEKMPEFKSRLSKLVGNEIHLSLANASRGMVRRVSKKNIEAIIENNQLDIALYKSLELSL
jgi:hypothetical protein